MSGECVSGLSGWILDFRMAHFLSAYFDQPCSHTVGGSLSYVSCICWQVSVLDVVPLAFALDKLLRTPCSGTHNSIIRMIINVTFSF